MDTWRKSSYSGPENPNCVECRADNDRVLVRDTGNREHGHLSFSPAEWRVFLAEVRQGTL